MPVERRKGRRAATCGIAQAAVKDDVSDVS